MIINYSFLVDAAVYRAFLYPTAIILQIKVSDNRCYQNTYT